MGAWSEGKHSDGWISMMHVGRMWDCIKMWLMMEGGGAGRAWEGKGYLVGVVFF
jgi:hypothetical protein